MRAALAPTRRLGPRGRIVVALALVACVLVFMSMARAAVSHIASLGTGTSGLLGLGATSITLNKPTSTASGDFLVVAVANRLNNPMATPSGWTRQIETSGAQDPGVTVFTKFATASEPSSYTFSQSSGLSSVLAGTISSFRGVDPITPIDAIAAQANALSSTATAPSISPTLTNTVLVSIFGTSGTSASTPAGQTLAASGSAANLIYAANLKTTFQTLAGAGATGTRVATLSGSDTSNGISLALRPAANNSISGTVYEDVNYGGGSGRTLSASGGAGVVGATVELYSPGSGLVASTTTNSSGGYTFGGLGNGGYFVRVVQTSVRSSRSGSVAGLLPVQTWRQEASWQTPAAVSDEVGGARPDTADSAAAASLTWTNCATEAGGSANPCSFSGTRLVRFGSGTGWTVRVATGGVTCSNAVFGDPTPGTTKTCDVLVPHLHSASSVQVADSSVNGLNFGFNFNAVVNTNDSGTGSLRQAMTHANTLGGDASLAQAGRTAGIEHLVFMVSNGTTGSGGSLGLTGGLRAANNFFTTSAGSYNVATIAPASSLPAVTSTLVMDAQTQPGWTLAPLIELNGAGAGASNGLSLSAANTTVRGFVINRFQIEGVVSGVNVPGFVIQGNYIGTDAAGMAASPNGNSGIWISQSGGGHLIGGTTAAQRNVLSGQSNFEGIAIGGGSGNTIQGNYIGLNAAGTAALANGRWGIVLYSGVNNSTIGGTAPGAGNVVSGNRNTGVLVQGPNITIQGNTIGLNAAGTAAVPNATQGLYLTETATGAVVGGTASGARNVLSGNAWEGIVVGGNNTTTNRNVTIQGNYIGTNSAGTAAIGNGRAGIYLMDQASGYTVGGTATGAGNLISGNAWAGLWITGANTVIQGNTIGLNAAGTSALQNGFQGIYMDSTCASTTIGGTVSGAGNVVSGNNEVGIMIKGTGTTVQGNTVGLNSAGTAAVPNRLQGIYISLEASTVTIGGSAATARNVISGNLLDGIRMNGNGNASTNRAVTIQGNYIGTSAAGTTAIANQGQGVYFWNGGAGGVIGGSTAGSGNLISGNTGAGVRVDGASHSVQGNLIGTNAAGTGLLGNGGGGVYSTANTVSIGGTAAGAGNVVAGNTGGGILVATGDSGNAIQGNAVYSNSGLGLDLGGDGVSANDGAKTSGAANLLMDTPIITAASLNGTSLTVNGYVGSAANQSTFASARIEVFANDPASSTPSGKTYLGALTANASGNFSGVITGVTGLTGGTSALTATATDAAGNTSEFGTRLTVTASAATLKAQWEFETFASNTTPDTSGNGNTLSLGASGVSQVTGLAGYGMSLNGASPASGASTGAKLTTTSSYTVSAWVKYNGMSTCSAQSAVAQEGVTTHAFEIALVPNCGLPQPLFFEILAADVDSSAVKRVFSTFTPTTGTWYHVAGVYDASSSTMSFYVNCALQGTQTGVTTYNASGPLVVGRSRFSASYRDPLNGIVDTVRIWSGVRSASEISTECVDPSHTLRAEYKFEQTSWSGTSGEVLDSTGNGYNGTAASLLTTKPTTTNVSPAIAGSSGTCRYGVFNRSNKDYVALPTSLPNLGSSSGFTGSAWIRTTNNALIGQRILIDDENNAGFTRGWVLSLGDAGAGILNFTTRAISSGVGSGLVTPSVIANNTWYFVAFGIDYASKTKFIRVLDTSGSQIASVSTSYTEANIGTDPGVMSIGGETNSATNENTSNFGFAGNIDDVRIHDGALSAAEINGVWALRTTCTSAIDHVEIQHATGTGLTCTPSSVTVRACQDATCSSLYTGGLTGTLTASGAQASVNWPNGAGFSIAAGSSSTTVSLQQTLAASAVLGVTGLSQASTNGATCNFGSPACTFTAADSGLLFDVPDHRAEVLQAITVSAVRKSDNSLSCTPAFASTNKSVNFRCGYTDPASGSRAVRVGGVALNAGNNSTAACDGTGASVSLAFNASGVASTTVQYADVGQMSLAATHTSTSNGTTLTMTGSDTFIAAPSSFGFSGITAAPIRAGNAFAATVSALNSAGAVTPNFGAEASPSSVTLSFAKRLPTGSGAAPGTFSGSLGAFSNGVAATSNLVWTEVGSADLSADLASPGYLGSGMTVTGTTGSGGAVGPFTPHHFDVVATAACSSFTYAGQPFGVTVTARNASNGVTVNYDGSATTAPNFAKTTTLSDAGTLGLGTWTGSNVTAGSFLAGVATLSPSYAFTSKLTTPQVLAVRASDTTGVSSQGHAEGSVALRSGRLRAFNRFGPNGVALAIPVQAEYWGGKAWVLNTADNCSVIPASAVSRVLYWDRQGAASAAWAGSDTGSAIVAGLGNLSIAAPPGSAFGSIDLALNLGSGSAADQSCLSSHATASGANLPWLRSQQGSCASGWAADPSVRATFGVRAPETRKTVHVREIY